MRGYLNLFVKFDTLAQNVVNIGVAIHTSKDESIEHVFEYINKVVHERSKCDVSIRPAEINFTGRNSSSQSSSRIERKIDSLETSKWPLHHLNCF